MGKNLKLPLAGEKEGLFDSEEPAGQIAFRPPEMPSWFPGGLEGPHDVRAVDRGCIRCDLSRSAHTVCMDSRGPTGGVLIVLPTPSDRDDRAGQIMEAGETGMIMAEVHQHRGAGVRYTYAVRCAAGREPTPESIGACRDYLLWEFLRGQPERVVLLGPTAAEAATGVALNAQLTRRARAHVRGIPCFLVQHPHQGAVRNRHHRRMFAQDLEWALKAPLHGDPDGSVRIFGLGQAQEAVDWLTVAHGKAVPIVVDAEHWPKSPWSPGEFRLLCLGLCQDLAAPIVLTEDLLKELNVTKALRSLLEDPLVPKVNQSIKHDSHVLWRALGIDLQGVEWDTLMAAKLLDSDAPAGLQKLSWLVGYGGYKEQGQIGSEEEDD